MTEDRPPEASSPTKSGPGESAPPAARASAGALLRAAREKQGLHIAALATSIKVSPRKLDALENDRWDELPDITFARALAQTVCRNLKVDAKPVLDLLPALGTASVAPNGDLNQPFREQGMRSDLGSALGAVRPMVWAAGLLLVAALLVYLWPFGPLPGLGADSTSGAAPIVLPVDAPFVAPTATELAASAAAQFAASGQALSGADPAFAAAPVAAVSAPAAAVFETVFAAPGSLASAAQATLAGVMVFRTTDASWIEVRDAGGQSLLNRTVLPGESVGVDGKLPLRVTVGNAVATEAVLRGEPFDLSMHVRGNVARFDVQ